MIKARALSPNSILFKFDSGLIALFSPDPARRLWRVSLVGRGARFALPLNMPLLAILAAVEGKGAGR